MAVIPVRFKRVAAAFHEEARARLCESSGTEHSSNQSLTDLSDLVDSFFEDQDGGLGGGVHGDDDAGDDKEGSTSETNCSDSEIKGALKKMFTLGSGCDADHDKVKRKIHALVVKSLREDDKVDVSGSDFKRRLMARLRRRGLDAGLCKSKWEKQGHCPAGDYEYIDVHASGARYFVEVSLAKEFTIARPTNCYSALLNMFPQIFVGKQDEVKKLTRSMCGAMKKSMKKMNIHVPPWRRLNYMQSKWFSSYKRTTNEAAASVHHHQEISEDPKDARRRKRSVGFAPASTISFLCRDDFSSRAGGAGGRGGTRVGNLAAEFNDNTILS